MFNEGFSTSDITTLTAGSSILSSNANVGRETLQAPTWKR